MSISELYRGMVSVPPAKGIDTNPRINREIEKQKGGLDFREILDKEQGKVNLSLHAEARIKSREIPWSPELESRISHGIDQASLKGSREALILAGDVAVIANVKSRTVVTAIDKAQLKEKVFTNIDSAVIV